jgi:adenylosuccinate lyase
MPHKINPIRFENAEANLEISAALFETMAATLVTSRWQRDLTDSTTLRNLGVAFGHSLLALNNITKGLASLEPDLELLAKDLDHNWEVLAEPIQTVMRAASIAGVPDMDNPYERLKDLTRGKRLDAAGMQAFVKTLGLPADAETRLIELTPGTYTGLAEKLVSTYLP